MPASVALSLSQKNSMGLSVPILYMFSSVIIIQGTLKSAPELKLKKNAPIFHFHLAPRAGKGKFRRVDAPAREIKIKSSFLKLIWEISSGSYKRRESRKTYLSYFLIIRYIILKGSKQRDERFFLFAFLFLFVFDLHVVECTLNAEQRCALKDAAQQKCALLTALFYFSKMASLSTKFSMELILNCDLRLESVT